MNYHVSTSATTIYNVKGVSPYDAALRIVTRLASKGGFRSPFGSTTARLAGPSAQRSTSM